MYNYSTPKQPKWVLRPESALQRFWSIDAETNNVTCGQAIQICNHITANMNLPATLRQRAFKRRNELILGKGRGGYRKGKRKPTAEVITMSRI